MLDSMFKTPFTTTIQVYITLVQTANTPGDLIMRWLPLDMVFKTGSNMP